MTGFGEAERDTAAGRLRAEARSVNHRFFSLNVRLARGVERFEPQIREWLRAQLPRGHVNFTLRLDAPGADGDDGVTLTVDEDRARQYVQALRSLKQRFDLPGDVDLALLARFTDLVVVSEAAQPPEPADVQAVTEAAARAVIAMREAEGLRLRADLDERLDSIAVTLARIADLAPARLVAERDRMRRVVAELLEGVPLDEDRLAREIAYIAERWDISEELVRLRSHIELFRQALADASPDPVGKRLSFLIQEMNRETNTIGSKANDAAIEHCVISIKDEVERLREQIENVE